MHPTIEGLATLGLMACIGLWFFVSAIAALLYAVNRWGAVVGFILWLIAIVFVGIGWAAILFAGNYYIFSRLRGSRG